MALDNPSYFSVAGASGTSAPNRTFGLFQQKPKMGAGASTSDSVSSTSSDLHVPPQGALTNRRALRSLLRSVSSNSADSNQELLIMGEPRPSDIAPSSPFPPNQRYSPNIEPRRSSSLKKTRVFRPDFFQQNDMMYNPIPTSEDMADNSDEEVFLAEDSARYYNFSAIPVDKRRHSIGTFMARERVCSVASSSKSFKEDFPQAIVHATIDGEVVKPISDGHVSTSLLRRPCNRCTRGNPARTRIVMDDIHIVSSRCSQTAADWVDYFTSCFNQISKQANRKPFKIQQLVVEDITPSNLELDVLEKRSVGVKLQVIIICPGLLEHISENPEPAAMLKRILSPDRSLALLLGVTDQDLTDVHREAFTNYQQWQRLGVGQDQDETFASEFLGLAMSIFTRMWQKQTSISAKDKSNFSVVPKKVKLGQNRIVVLLTDPLKKEDVVKVSIERNSEISEILSVKRRNPYTLKFAIPNSYLEVSAIVNILVEKNGRIIGTRPIKCESRLRELDQILRSSDNPLEFMCQTLGCPIEKETLDSWMVHNFQKNLPPNFNLVYASTYPNIRSASATKLPSHGHEEYPTLLHFAARFGLEKMAMQLLECPGGDLACEIRNACDLTPADIAEAAGHTDLGHMLGGYMKMNEFSNMYQKFKEISINPTKIHDIDEEDEYLQPREYSENQYKICPAPRPVNPLHARTPSPNTSDFMSHENYLSMNPALSDKFGSLKTAKNSSMHESKYSLNSSTTSHKDSSSGDINQKFSKNHSMPDDKVQRELAEIMIDCKNNVHSIEQAEKLVGEWKNRNDVQKSYKEKYDQLKDMRLQYEKIQQAMNEDMKSGNPFYRLKKLFSRKPKTTDSDSVKAENLSITLPAESNIFQNHRPISSLSTQSTSSSSSSGRLSTLSAGSVGDSGTHSDADDRKQFIKDSELNKNMYPNYSFPPAPKPIPRPMPKSTMNIKSRTFATIDERPPQPTPRIEESYDSYYIQFPPSNQPVNAPNVNKHDDDNDDPAEYVEVDDNEAAPSVKFSVKHPADQPDSRKHVATIENDETAKDYMNFPAGGFKNTDVDLPEYMNCNIPSSSH